MDLSKVCTKCGLVFPLEQFAKASHHKYGRGSWCRICKNAAGKARRLADVQKARDQKAAWRRNNPGYFLRKYWPGFTAAQAWEAYNELLEVQAHRCAICLRHKSVFKTPLEVDHCHATNKVRGLLCPGCNPAIGGLQDSPEVCLRAAHYLSKNP